MNHKQADMPDRIVLSVDEISNLKGKPVVMLFRPKLSK